MFGSNGHRTGSSMSKTVSSCISGSWNDGTQPGSSYLALVSDSADCMHSISVFDECLVSEQENTQWGRASFVLYFIPLKLLFLEDTCKSFDSAPCLDGMCTVIQSTAMILTNMINSKKWQDIDVSFIT
ncbi:hypothetical protein BaRGS_00015010, partial [Batillaria attramentaria]